MLDSIFHDIDITQKSLFYCENIKLISLLWTSLHNDGYICKHGRLHGVISLQDAMSNSMFISTNV